MQFKSKTAIGADSSSAANIEIDLKAPSKVFVCAEFYVSGGGWASCGLYQGAAERCQVVTPIGHEHAVTSFRMWFVADLSEGKHKFSLGKSQHKSDQVGAAPFRSNTIDVYWAE